MRFGAIYIAHNPRDGATIFKVGKTERSVSERMRELSASTSTLGTYTARAFFIVRDVDAAEAACHKRLARYRVQNNREFFSLPFLRLLQMVQEEVTSYAARDFVPELPPEDTPLEALPKTATEILQAARQQKQRIDELWETALEKTKNTLNEWQVIIREKARQTAKDLHDVDILEWEILNDALDFKSLSSFCSVLVLSKFNKKPLALTFTTVCKGIVKRDLDLSRAISEPKVERMPSFGKTKFVKWQELDDGRIGRLSLLPEIVNNFKNDRGTLPFPGLQVRATRISYDSYHHSFEEEHHTREYFNNPEEAFEVFLSLVIANSVAVQYDVRSVSTHWRHRDGSPNISDHGKLNTDSLRRIY